MKRKTGPGITRNASRGEIMILEINVVALKSNVTVSVSCVTTKEKSKGLNSILNFYIVD